MNLNILSLPGLLMSLFTLKKSCCNMYKGKKSSQKRYNSAKMEEKKMLNANRMVKVLLVKFLHITQHLSRN